MENRFKVRISRMFRSSFVSCRCKNITDVIEKPIFLPENRQHQHQHHQLIELFSPKPRPFPPVCRKKYPHTFQAEQNCSIINKNLKKSLLLSTDMEGQKCPPASPISPLMNTFYQFQEDCAAPSKTKLKKNKKSLNKRVRLNRSKSFGHREFPALSYNGLFSSDDEEEDDDDKTTLFSSRSLSSDSSESCIRSQARKSNKKPSRRTARYDQSEAAGAVPEELKGKVKDSFAVVKRSSDPYNDFRTSMVEMIVERKIFSAKELENLLQCFLSLNSTHHHRVIIEVFTEIWEALFCEWS